MSHKALDEIVEKEILKYKQRKSLIFLEAAISDVLENHSLDEAKKILHSYQEFLEEF